jgi:hypothetical protein
MGYFRPVGADGVELSLAHPTGITEVSAGTLIGTRIDLASVTVGQTPTAKEVAAVERTIEVDDDHLRYTVRMAAVGQPLQHHLSASLRRV